MPEGGGGGWSTQRRSTFASRWDKSTSKAILQGILEAVTLPGDVYRGEVDPRSDEAIGRAFDLAGTLGTGGLATASKRAGVGVFGGRLAKTADLEKLKVAEDMAAKGAWPDEIWGATGWYRGADDKWKFEIPDNKSYVFAGSENAGSTGQAIHHPELFEAYPDLKDIDASVQKGKRSGVYFPHQSRENEGLFDIYEEIRATGSSNDELRKVLLHELQHAVQQREGFAQGGSPGMFVPDKRAADDMIEIVNENLSEISKSMDVARASKDTERLAELQGRYDSLMAHKLQELVPRAQVDPIESYRNLAGEVEARNVSDRMDWDAKQRRDIPPQFSQDVPDERQVVRMDSTGRNYVVFDDSLISILKKYGVVGPVLAALGLSQALPDRAEAAEQSSSGW